MKTPTPRNSFAIATTAVGLLIAPQTALSQQSTSNISVPRPAIATAIRAQPLAPRIDGVLDDGAWQDAPVHSDFMQRDPDEGLPATERTEFRVVYTDATLYIAVRAFDRQPGEIAAHLTRRDEFSPSDWISVQIDSYRDRRTAFEFAVNPAGVKLDRYMYDDNNSDRSWNAIWDVATTIDAQGWTAEFAIPLSQLRFTKADETTFGFNIVRDINRRNESQYWKLRPKDARGVVSLFGDLVGLSNIVPPRRVEVLPYTVLSNTASPSEANNPFQTGNDRSATMGADFNIGVTPALTLSATIRPDFGQVEADPAVVNLSAFETFFPEQRPFFNEGLDIFQFGIAGNGREQLFYTRRVGRSPQGSPDSRGGFAERVNHTDIHSAAKLSGKTQSGWTIGLLGARTAAERADVLGGDGNPYSDLVEPGTTYLVGRLAKDLREGQTVLGTFGTLMDRGDLENLSFLRTSAFTGGADLTHRFKNDTWSLDGRIMGSRINGSSESIRLAQLSSARYFQRPDNDHTVFDSTRTSLSGFAGAMNFGKNAGNVRFTIGVDTRSPGFEVNDLGFQNQTDNTGGFVWVQRRWLTPGKVFRRASVNFNAWTNYTHGWERKNSGGNINANATFLNYWNANVGMNINVGGLGVTDLRGGPGFQRPNNLNGWFFVGSDFRKPLRANLNGFFWNQAASGSHGYGITPSVSWRAATNMDFSFGPNFNGQRDTWQFLRQEDVGSEREFIFGELEQTTVSMQFRGNMTFSPDLSLQIYAEPFVSSGDYVDYRRVADPRGETFDDRIQSFADDRVFIDNGDVSLDVTGDGTADIDLGNPDFTFLSFRSNVVLRWEYNLGSTLFLVWQHGRSGFNQTGQFDFRSSVSDIFDDTEATNTFLVKFNYWLSL